MIATAECPKCSKLVSLPDEATGDAQVRCPCCSAEYPLSSLRFSAPPELILLSPSGNATAGKKSPAVQHPATTPGIKAEPLDVGVASACAGGEHLSVSGLASFAYGRPKRPPKSAWRTLIEIVAGGLAGCVVAYYALAIYFGPRFHQLGLPWANRLPFIQRITAPRGNHQNEGLRQKPRNSRSSKPAGRSLLPACEKQLAVLCRPELSRRGFST